MSGLKTNSGGLGRSVGEVADFEREEMFFGINSIKFLLNSFNEVIPSGLNL